MASKPAVTVHDDSSIPLFIGSYLAVMETKKPAMYPLMAQHLLELMGDVELYSWEPFGAFHAMWLQQLEHGHVTWASEDTKIKFMCMLVWHHTTTDPKPVPAPSQQPQKKSAKEGQMYNILARS